MKWLRYLLISLTLVSTSLVRAEEFKLTEASLMKILGESPESSRLEAELLATKVNYDRADDPFYLSLDGTAGIESSREEPVVAQIPVTKKASVWELGINRPLPYGVNLGLAYSQQKSTSFVENAATTRLVGKVSIDLFRDFLGKTSMSVLQDARLGYEAGKLQDKINKKALQFRIRGLFWNYVAAKEARDFAEDLLGSSSKQLKLVRRKQRSDVADSGDIARFSSQVSERRSQSLQFEANMKQFEVNFGEFFPSLIGKKLSLGKYDKDQTMKEFFQCLGVIEAQKEIPKKYTLFDEIIELRRKQLAEQKRSLSSFSDIDIKIEGQVGLVGTGIGTSAANRSFSDDKNDFNSIGLTMSLPLDGKRGASERSQMALAEAQIDAEVRALDAKFMSLHSALVENIKLIRGIIENRSENSEFLKRALLDSRKKYRQARITSQQLLQEEDNYLSNAIQLITTQRDILLFMFDYLSLFTETPCQLNEVKS